MEERKEGEGGKAFRREDGILYILWRAMTHGPGLCTERRRPFLILSEASFEDASASLVSCLVRKWRVAVQIKQVFKFILNTESKSGNYHPLPMIAVVDSHGICRSESLGEKSMYVRTACTKELQRVKYSGTWEPTSHLR